MVQSVSQLSRAIALTQPPLLREPLHRDGSMFIGAVFCGSRLAREGFAALVEANRRFIETASSGPLVSGGCVACRRAHGSCAPSTGTSLDSLAGISPASPQRCSTSPRAHRPPPA